jgi:hypothetical protein
VTAVERKEREMTKKLVVACAIAVAAVALTASAVTAGIGPPSGTIYAFDQAYKTIGTPTSLPNKGPTDTLYVFPDCADCAAVSDAAPGYPDYNGGRWKVVEAYGITAQLTNADAVVAAASSLVDTGTRFVCPLKKN